MKLDLPGNAGKMGGRVGAANAELALANRQDQGELTMVDPNLRATARHVKTYKKTETRARHPFEVTRRTSS
jgi:hypothetical protein